MPLRPQTDIVQAGILCSTLPGVPNSGNDDPRAAVNGGHDAQIGPGNLWSLHRLDNVKVLLGI
jgi:hypothetical protein